ncbi:MAG: hypothetical protein RL266_914 [Bacteroidota bacterium]|jgi:beta-lactamase class A
MYARVILIWAICWHAITCLGQNAERLAGNNYSALRRTGAFFTAPLQECACTDTYVPEFKSELEQYLKNVNQRGTRISVYFRDLHSGQSYGVDEDAFYSPASMLKVADMMRIFKMAEADPEILNEPIVINKSGASALGNSKLDDGQSYSVDRVITEMIVESDNHAMQALQRHFNDNHLWKPVFRALGETIDFRADNAKCLSPKAYSVLFKALFNGSYLTQYYSQKALELLARTSFDKGIVAGVSDTSTTVANKYGYRELSNTFQLHETAIVYLQNSPYLLSIMTETSKPDGLAKILRDVSLIIYRKMLDKTLIKVNNRSYQEGLVHPLLQCFVDSVSLLPTKSLINTYITDALKTDSVEDASVFLIHFNSESYININGGARFRPGLLMRVPHMMALLKASEKKPELLYRKFLYEGNPDQNEQPISYKPLVSGQQYTVIQLIENMVYGSDQEALDLLYTSSLNDSEIWKQFFEMLGISHLWVNNRFSGNMTTEEYAKFFRILYNSTFLNNRNSELALEILSKNKLKRGIRKGVGKDDITALRLGEMLYEQGNKSMVELHEAGIVYAEDNPYVLCIMTKGTSAEQQMQLIEKISSTVYSSMQKAPVQR